ncbi:MAG: MMPL family transporter [Myxococcota bacterium]|nr:MMPL family transporter [Myxococcota bacterium]
MANILEVTHARPTRTLLFARWIVRNKFWVAMGLLLTTLFFFYPILNAITRAWGIELPGPYVSVDTSARAQWPDHPFIHAQDKFAKKFGTSSLVAIGVAVKDGTIFTPETLAKLNEITRRLDGVGYDSKIEEREALRDALQEQGGRTDEQILRELDRRFPPYPVNHDQVRSLAHSSTRAVQIEPDGSITSDILMKKVPENAEEAEKLRGLVLQNPPFIYGRLVSWDEKGALVSAGFITDRLNSSQVYTAVFNHVEKIKLEFQDPACAADAQKGFGARIFNSLARLVTTATTEPTLSEGCNFQVYVSGEPVHIGWIIKHAFEIGIFVILTVLVVFALLLGYFRRLHGVLIPFVAAIATVIWGAGFTGWWGVTFDPLVLVIPMIITARAISHTVQMAERFFEDYEILAPLVNDPETAKTEAATIAMAELIVPGTLGIITDVAGLAVIALTTIPQLYELAVFGAFWVLAILATVELLHPVMICYMPPPEDHQHFLPESMVRFMTWVGDITTHPTGKYVIGGITVVLFVWSFYITLFDSKIGQATPGSPLLWPDHEFNVATDQIARRFGGVDSFVVFSSGDRENASADPLPIQRMTEFERWMATHTNLGASISIAPIIRGYWRMNHYGDPKWQFVPLHPGTVRTVIFQLRTNGAPGFLRPFMTDDSRDANVAFYYPDHKGETITQAVRAADYFIKQNPMGEVIVRLDMDKAGPDEPWWSKEALTDLWYYMLGPMLPTRDHTLHVQVRKEGINYDNLPIHVSEDGLPAWLGEFRDGAVADYENERDSIEEGEFFTWPEGLADWGESNVDAWWESEEFGIRAVAINTNQLIVQDLKSVEPIPRYQATSSWTRGVQFVMAGGIMGILGAINDEVERGHIANITLILFVIFVLHSVTYQSMVSGGIILLQISTATLLSLAYMAIRGIGLNINTLPVQSVGVGIGVDYAIYIVDRIRQECGDTQDIDEAVRRAVRTTGMAVSFTATTIVGGIFLWSFSNLRFQAEMAQLLVILMVINMLGAITVVPAFYSILRPSVVTAVLSEDQKLLLQAQKEREIKIGLRKDE